MEFVRQVQQSKVKHPTSKGFSLKKWQLEFEKTITPSEADTRLYEIGKWTYSNLEEIRGHLAAVDFTEFDRGSLLQAQVGVANRVIYIMQHTHPRSDDDGPLMIEQAIQGKVGKQISANPNATHDSVLAATLDSVRYPVQHALTTAEVKKSKSNDNLSLKSISNSNLLAQYYETFERVWMSALWEGDYLAVSSHDFYHVMPVIDQNARSGAASAFRREVLSAELTQHFNSALKQMSPMSRDAIFRSKPVVKWKGRKKELDVTRGYEQDDRCGVMLIYDTIVRNDYFEPFFSLPLPKAPSLTIDKIYAVWEVLHATAACLLDSIGKTYADKATKTLGDIKVYAPTVYLDQLHRIIQKHTSLSSDIISKALDFLAFRGDVPCDAWSHAVVRVDRQRIILIFGPLLWGSMPRIVETWMKSAAMDIGDSGSYFEQHARLELAASAIKSDLSLVTEVYPQNLKLGKNFESEEIDLVIRVGNKILLGEAKCTLFPAEPIERSRYLEILKKAASQIKRKTKTVALHSTEFLSELGWSGVVDHKTCTYHPFILVNQPYGVGVDIDGVPVTDLLILQKYFEGNWEQFAIFQPDGTYSAMKTIQFYSTVKEGEDHIDEYIANPPQLAHYFKNVKPVSHTIPPLHKGGKPIVISHVEVELPLPAISYIFQPK